MSEKQKITAEDMAALPDITELIELVPGENGTMEFRFNKNVSLKEQAKFACQKYGISLDDLQVKYNKLIIKKNGKLTYAKAQGFEKNELEIIYNGLKDGTFIIKAKVYFKGYIEPFEDFGMCARDEPGKSNWTLSNLLETASTRAILRAITVHLPMRLQDEVTDEQINDNIEKQIESDNAHKLEKQLEMKEKKETQKEESKLSNATVTAKKKVKASKPADDEDFREKMKAATEEINDEYTDGPPEGI